MSALRGRGLEARALHRSGERLFLPCLRVLAAKLISFLVIRLGIRLRDFDPAVYRHDVVENSDFRKFDDSLRMTFDCAPAIADRIEARLARAESAGVAGY
jgi:hypothetical protein